MEKVVRDGKIAVLYSPDYGAGWFTWHHEEALLFDPNIVYWIEAGEREKIATYVSVKYPDIYMGGLDDLTIEWLPVGTKFRINEYDGNESIELKEEMNWIVA